MSASRENGQTIGVARRRTRKRAAGTPGDAAQRMVPVVGVGRFGGRSTGVPMPEPHPESCVCGGTGRVWKSWDYPCTGKPVGPEPDPIRVPCPGPSAIASDEKDGPA